MPGKRNPNTSDYVTPIAIYRTVLSSEPDDPTSSLVPVLDTTKGGPALLWPNQPQDQPSYGRNSQINLYVIMTGFTECVLHLWFDAAVTANYLAGQAPPDLDPFPPTGEWVFVVAATVTGSQSWNILDIPPGRYKILVVSTTGGPGAIRLREQHAY